MCLIKYEFIVFINTKLLQIHIMSNFKVVIVLGCNGCSSSSRLQWLQPLQPTTTTTLKLLMI